MAKGYNSHLEKLQLISSGKLSLTENINYFLKEIENNQSLNCFNFVFVNEALNDAKRIEDKIKHGTYGKLAGMVIAVKDVLAIKDKPLTCSSKILKDFTSIYTATSIQNLIDEDAIIIGKTNCDEFAMGSSNENSAFGAVLNPIDNSRVPGGSSGGSAVAVAAGLCDAAIGTDTGGSIRQPAAFCGIIGLKPTYGLVSRYGLTAFASSFDSVGPFTESIEDASLLLEVLSGNDPKDATSIKKEKFNYSLELTSKPVIGLPKQYFADGLNPEILDAVKFKVNQLETDGFIIKEVDLNLTNYSIAAYYVLTTAEAASNLSRFDGARYGYRSEKSGTLEEMYSNSRTEGFGTEVKRRIMLGTYVLSSGYYDAYFKKAQKVRRLIKQQFDDVFNEVDILLSPVTPTTAFKLGEKISDPLQMYLNDIYTTSANLAGIPGISIPVAKDSDGLPIGLQLMANSFQEEKLLKLSNYMKNL